MASTTLGLGMPIGAPTTSLTPWGLSPYSGVTTNPFTVPQLGFNPYAAQPLQQISQVLQIVPQQLQQLLQLEHVRQHQLQQLQQTLQFFPVQLAQLQQLIQFAPHHIQPLQQPFGTVGAALPSSWGVSPQMMGAQPSYVM
jgi:hypothetical protein